MLDINGLLKERKISLASCVTAIEENEHSYENNRVAQTQRTRVTTQINETW